MNLDYTKLGQRIRSVRKKKGLTQFELSEQIGRSAPYISYIENGNKTMSLETLVLIANRLNVSADELLMDSLENTVKVTNHAFASIIADCSDYELRILLDVIRTTKQSLRNHKS